MKNKFFIGVDVGGTKIAAALMTDDGTIIIRNKVSTPPFAHASSIYKTIASLIDDLIIREKIKKKNLAGIGLGVPGIVNAKENKIVMTPNISLTAFPLAKKLKAKFHAPIGLENDVNCGLLGEQWLGAGKNVKNLVGIFPGTGVGGAIIINGKLYTGHQGAAGEIGHMIVDLNGPPCGCGNRGCLEATTSRWAIERDIRQRIKQGKNTIIRKLVTRDLTTIKSKTLREALDKKDPLVTEVMQNAARVLGTACVSLNHIFNPEMIILGGGVIEACGSFIIPIVKRIVAADPFFKNLKTCQILPSQLADDAVILGAAALFKDKKKS